VVVTFEISAVARLRTGQRLFEVKWKMLVAIFLVQQVPFSCHPDAMCGLLEGSSQLRNISRIRTSCGQKKRISWWQSIQDGGRNMEIA
jgi:hypothetical protein